MRITHSASEGTLIEGTSRGDGSAAVLKAHRWRWSRTLGLWYVPRSRDAVPQRDLIEQTAESLREKGFEVEVEIDDTRRSTAEVEADKVARQEQRVAVLAARAERAVKSEDAADAATAAAVDQLPPFGEPIKLGHHSEGRHRRALDRVHRAHDRLHEATEGRRRAEEAAREAAATTGARYSVRTVGNRIQRIEADLRKAHRESHLAARIPELEDQLTYWSGVRAQQLADGAAKEFDRSMIKRGDAVKIGNQWVRVLRANPKTVTVESGCGFELRKAYHLITDHRPAPTSGDQA